MNNYRTGVSRDRLAEFKRNSANMDTEKASLNRQQHQHKQQKHQSLTDNGALYYNGFNSTFYPPTTQSQSGQAYHYHGSKYEIPEHRSVSPADSPYTSNVCYDVADDGTTETFFSKVENVKWIVSKINENITEIEWLQNSMLSSNNGQKSSTLEELICQTSEMNKKARDRIKEIESSNAKLTRNSNDLQMRQAQTQALKKRFIETIQRYQGIAYGFEKKFRQRIERQILIVQPEATTEEIELAIESDQVPQTFAHSFLNSSRQGNSIQVLNEVQTRHQDIKRIEKTILELHQLFLDMQTIVEMQQETLTDIEKMASNTNYDLEKGNKHANVAIKTTKMTRKKKWFYFIMLIILLAVTGFIIWWFVSHRS